MEALARVLVEALTRVLVEALTGVLVEVLTGVLVEALTGALTGVLVETGTCCWSEGRMGRPHPDMVGSNLASTEALDDCHVTPGAPWLKLCSCRPLSLDVCKTSFRSQNSRNCEGGGAGMRWAEGGRIEQVVGGGWLMGGVSAPRRRGSHARGAAQWRR